MSHTLNDIIKYDSESVSLDYKMEQYPIGKHAKKFEILKDISAFANHPKDNDKYIIIGVIEKDGVAHDFSNIDELVDESKYQQLVESNIEPKINFEYKLFEYNGYKLAYFRIYDNRDRPYLIRKDVQNPVLNKNEYKEGDGFIRFGTSTKKMNRADFDRLYELKFKSKDRKPDLEIIPYWGAPNDEKLSRYNLKYLDLEIRNLSNKSIDFDIEMKVIKSESYDLLSERGLKKELRKISRIPFEFDADLIQPPNLHVDYENEKDWVIISRNCLGNRKTAMRLPQDSSEKDIFTQYLFVLEETSNIIRAEVTIRCDDFTDGVLNKQLEFHT